MDSIKVYNYFRIDLKDDLTVPLIDVSQNDVYSNVLNITLLNNGDLVKLSDSNVVTLNVNRPSGNVSVISGEFKENGTCDFILDYTSISEVGICTCTIKVAKNNSIATSKSFAFNVCKDAYVSTNDIKNENNFPILNSLISKLSLTLTDVESVEKFYKDNLNTFNGLKDISSILVELANNKDEAKDLIETSKILRDEMNKSSELIKTFPDIENKIRRLINDCNSVTANTETTLSKLRNLLSDCINANTKLENNIKTYESYKESFNELKVLVDNSLETIEKLKSYKVDADIAKIALDTSVSLANSKKAELNDVVNNASGINTSLGGKISDGKAIVSSLTQKEDSANIILENLKSEVNIVEGIKNKIDESISNAKESFNSLDESNKNAKSLNDSIKNNISKAINSEESLSKALKNAETINNDLYTKLKDSESLKNTLEDDISKGNLLKTELVDKVNRADESNNTLGKINTTATDNINTLKDLLKKVGVSEQTLNEIIASADLSKYVTDPKLQEALKFYATKKDLQSIDVTSQLTDYAKKTEVPTKLSQLNNDKTFKTETEIQTMINNSAKLKKEVVTSLPSSGKEDIIYLLKNKNDNNNFYTEYLWIGGKWEIIGDTKVDLSGYAKKTEVVTSVNGKKGDMMVDFFIGDDTRNLNYVPKDYLEHGVRYKSYINSQFEFKRCNVVRVGSLITQTYCIVNTQVPWADASGGLPMQVAYGKGVIAVRDAVDENTWGEWRKVSTSSDIKTKLSEMTSDSTHRTVTDSEKATWDTVTNKVAKVTGKSLSTNDFTDVAKEKVDAIPSNPKYTDTVTSINDKTGAISKADIVALGIPSKDTTYGLVSQSSNGLMSAADKKRLDNIKEQVALTEAQYNALSSTQQNDSKKIYFIKA